MSFLEKAVTDRFEEQGYVVAEGILDPVEDIGPIVAEYEELLDSMAGQWHAEGRAVARRGPALLVLRGAAFRRAADAGPGRGDAGFPRF